MPAGGPAAPGGWGGGPRGRAGGSEQGCKGGRQGKKWGAQGGHVPKNLGTPSRARCRAWGQEDWQGGMGMVCACTPSTSWGLVCSTGGWWAPRGFSSSLGTTLQTYCFQPTAGVMGTGWAERCAPSARELGSVAVGAGGYLGQLVAVEGRPTALRPRVSLG